ncbi:MAG: SsrA-binding protein SmpB [Fimbriimonadaceae bacterium]|nr:SsrA-binding protein SmpB [Fimbriimonadaceae bacterium]
MAKKAGKKADKSGPATIQNRRATFDYEITDTLECGIALAGSEVKSLYHGRANLTDGYVRIENGELWIHGLDIEPWSHSSAFTPDRRRVRKLLAHRREIDTLERKAQEKGLALIPLRVYFHNRRAKVLIGIARGKRQYDKRESIKEKDSRRRGEDDY